MAVIVSIGIDLVNLSRFRQRLESPSFRARVFTKPELAEAEIHGGSAEALATKFAYKEAVMKCLGAGVRQGVWFSQIGVTGEGARTRLDLQRCARDIADAFGQCYWHLSNSTNGDYVIAQAILMAGNNKTAIPTRQNRL